MRRTLLGSCLLTLSIGIIGCDDGMKKEPAAAPGSVAPVVTPPAGDAPKEGMGGVAPKEGMAPAPSTPPAEAPK